MDSAFLFSIISVLIVSVISLIGAVTISINTKFLGKIVLFLVSLAAGTLLGDVFFHIIPELYEHGDELTNLIPIAIIIGVMIFFFMEKILHWHHCHKPEEHGHTSPLAINNLVADGLHNFIDGMIIASSFLVSTEIGIATTVAVILHEIPQEIGDFGVLIHSGLKRKKALLLNFLSALFAILGTLITFGIGQISEEGNLFLLAVAAGGFLYISIGDLMAELKQEESLKKSMYQFLIVIFGILLMFGFTFIESHARENEEDAVHLEE